MTELSISTGAGVFDAIVSGPPEGRPVLLLHGFPQTGLVWERQIASLAAHGYRVVAPDQRGYSVGARPQRPEDYRIGLLVDDVVAITEELGWPEFDVVGHDWGGAVAWWTAHFHPGRVRTLTVVSTPHPAALATALRTDQDQRERSHYMIDWRETPATEERMLAHNAQELRDLYAGKVPQDNAEAYVRHLSQPGALTAALNWYRAGRPDGAIGVIDVPTLYVWSTEDSAFGPAAAQETGRWVNGPYRCEILQGVSHWVPEEAPETLSRLLLEHLRAHGEYGTGAHTPLVDSPNR
ncbi:alpha/beta fold hydrolase [Streptomyces sp. Ag109_G2-15]|uniref:alpha/beta fold hydrolase n=1 Tax=Streptomyces sp. Ag109_G2-15 TaxID=1938850 RepID=UPI000BC97938|nr:alpha/beta hydrolase [Streptomyces sp. Ag109_G2-15]SOE06654.1 Pimeloyl-ACP methyl ester carboxylesterase [Streptomyces sp. Ag109_G2-15]